MFDSDEDESTHNELNKVFKNFGFAESSDEEDEIEIKARPKNAGVSLKLSKPKNNTKLCTPHGLWEIGKQNVTADTYLNCPGTDDEFTQTKICLPFQKSLQYYQQNLNCTSTQTRNTAQKIENIQDRIHYQNSKLKLAKERSKNRIKVKKLLESLQDPERFDFDSALQCLELLAKDPDLIKNKAKDLFGKKDGLTISPKNMALEVITVYLSPLINSLNASSISDWNQAHDWMARFSDHIKDPGLWERFILKRVFTRIKRKLSIENSQETAMFVCQLYDNILISRELVRAFILFDAKNFILKNLSKPNFADPWEELSKRANIEKDFNSLIIEHASLLLQSVSLGDPEALAIVHRWPEVLQSSQEFFRRTIEPRLREQLESGDISALSGWIDIIPVDFTSELVSNYYIRAKITALRTISDIKTAVSFYRDFRSQIPDSVLVHPRVISNLKRALDILKSKSPVLAGYVPKSVQAETGRNPSIAEFLEALSDEYNVSFTPAPLVGEFPAYTLGQITVVVKSKVLYVLDGKELRPVYVNELKSMLR